MLNFKGADFNVNLYINKDCAYIADGKFGEISLVKSPLFYATFYNCRTEETKKISSADTFDSVCAEKTDGETKICFNNPDGISDIAIELMCSAYELGLEWKAGVINNSSEWSVIKISYPAPVASAPYYDLFVPCTCGRVIEDAGNKKFSYLNNYLSIEIPMAYFAVYGKNSGIYIGIEDEKASIKEFDIKSGEDGARVVAGFFGIDGKNPANSFQLTGTCRWQYFGGDWYDATMIYKDFVVNKTDWLPQIDENGRLDTPQKFKDVSYWVCDYIPNNEYQRDNRPMNLSAGSDIYEPTHWYEAVIKLQKELGVPIAYHVYNWHSIPFNIEYPHFLPAKDEFEKGLRELKKHDIYVLPYINSVSWEINDSEGNHDITFENTGKNGAVIQLDGSIHTARYPQTTRSGKDALLAPICPSFEKWHEIIGDIITEIEQNYDVDGVYFDEIAAHAPKPCYNPLHNHAMGGGSYWVDGYRNMMDKINLNKPEDHFYFTEGSGEPYIKNFDGLLTWIWVYNNDVPAFPAIYAGYTEMIGRVTMGKKKEDTDFFKYSLVKSFLYGQQLGWEKADVIYNEYRIDFLKKVVATRHKYNKFFHSASLLRPPVIESNISPVITEPALWYCEDIVMQQVLCGSWRERQGDKILVFVFNNADTESEYTMTIPYKEYGISKGSVINGDYTIDGDKLKISDKLPALSHKVYEFMASEHNCD